jgi:hypothetical protein
LFRRRIREAASDSAGTLEARRKIDEHDSASSPLTSSQGHYDATDVDVHVAILVKLTDFASIVSKAHDREAAFVIWHVRSTNVEKAGAIRQFDNVVDMRRDAGFLVDEFAGFVSRDAWLGM